MFNKNKRGAITPKYLILILLAILLGLFLFAIVRGLWKFKNVAP